MKEQIYQIVVKWYYTNRIAVYNFTDSAEFKRVLDDCNKYSCTILTTNIIYTSEFKIN